MSLLKLTIATTDYDHFRDFRLGLVKAEGIDHTWLTLGHHEMLRALHRQPRIRCLGALVRQVLGPGDAQGPATSSACR